MASGLCLLRKNLCLWTQPWDWYGSHQLHAGVGMTLPNSLHLPPCPLHTRLYGILSASTCLRGNPTQRAHSGGAVPQRGGMRSRQLSQGAVRIEDKPTLRGSGWDATLHFKKCSKVLLSLQRVAELLSCGRVCQGQTGRTLSPPPQVFAASRGR